MTQYRELYAGKDFANTLLEKATILPPPATRFAACVDTKNVPRKFV
ncbi:hypothetical protein pah_c009o024 [Parachlamydia acanthamoebae str. Hall's coccus]|nr:hypothetical protein pah_c009o024 [Parachlamydia acanthamoebae str. Hall's coccus]